MVDEGIDFRQLLAFYRQQVYGNFLPYWLRQVDWEYGGVLNCLDNRGERRLHDHKFVWSQGRFAWEMSRAYEVSAGEVDEETRRRYLEAAEGTVDFLLAHARLDNGNCAFVLSREGRPILLAEDGSPRAPREGEVYDYGISADRFAAYGVAEFARVTGNEEAYRWAKDLFQSVQRRFSEGTARNDYPYPPIPGYRAHRMSTVEYAGELARVARKFGEEDFASSLDQLATECMNEILDRFVQPDGLMRERLGEDYSPRDTLIGRYVNPGHTLEAVWFMVHHALRTGDRRVVERCAELARTTCRVAWDGEFGGIPQFIDCEGGPPKGSLPTELETHPMVRKLRTLADKKLWWPHSEALYTLLLLYKETGREWALQEYRRFHDYSFRTFPHPDPRVGEWIQIRNRRGEPEETVVALPVKDPMHIVRAFLHIIDLLEGMTGED